ncbi:hypothetical protein [Peribacillus sp. NPDC058075]|uniref:hypothetical protein n=1 Tax=unclassified Peribacillus TaxID=2675266 RepID=UPI0036DE2DDE
MGVVAISKKKSEGSVYDNGGGKLTPAEALVQYIQLEEYQYSNHMHNMVMLNLYDFGKL